MPQVEISGVKFSIEKVEETPTPNDDPKDVKIAELQAKLAEAQKAKEAPPAADPRDAQIADLEKQLAAMSAAPAKAPTQSDKAQEAVKAGAQTGTNRSTTPAGGSPPTKSGLDAIDTMTDDELMEQWNNGTLKDVLRNEPVTGVTA